jgi:hypothetical protein
MKSIEEETTDSSAVNLYARLHAGCAINNSHSYRREYTPRYSTQMLLTSLLSASGLAISRRANDYLHRIQPRREWLEKSRKSAERCLERWWKFPTHFPTRMSP